MKVVKFALLVVGVLATLLGLLWIGQGTGTFPYPAGNFMIDQTIWAYRGVGLAIAGLIAIVVSRRLR
ncbi:MAG: hypothetical protein WCC64_15685 [Aliidongia sp.]